MKNSPKTKKVVIYPERSFNVGPDVLKMTFSDLKDFLGGRLATALFKGNFDSALYDVLYVAEQWGEHSYHQRLLEDSRKA